MPNEPESRRFAVAVVDDDEMLLDTLTMFLRAKGYRTRGFKSGRDLLELLDWASGVDCVVCDVRMQGMDGIELLKRMRAAGRDVPVVMISGHADIPMAVQALKHGAHDFLEKPLDAEQLAQTVAEAVNCKRAGYANREESDRLREAISTLTTQQRRVLQMVADGMSSKEIAAELSISHRTVEVHRSAIMRKLGAESLADMIRAQLLAGMVTSGSMEPGPAS